MPKIFGREIETLKQAGLVYIRKQYPGYHILKDIETGKLELWCNRKHYAGYCLIYKNTHLEFIRSIPFDSPLYNENAVRKAK